MNDDIKLEHFNCLVKSANYINNSYNDEFNLFTNKLFKFTTYFILIFLLFNFIKFNSFLEGMALCLFLFIGLENFLYHYLCMRYYNKQSNNSIKIINNDFDSIEIIDMTTQIDRNNELPSYIEIIPTSIALSGFMFFALIGIMIITSN